MPLYQHPDGKKKKGQSVLNELYLHLQISDQPAFPQQVSAAPELLQLVPNFYSCKEPRLQAKILQIACPGWRINIVVGMWHRSSSGTYLLPWALPCREKVSRDVNLQRFEDRFAPREQSQQSRMKIHLLLNLHASADVDVGPKICVIALPMFCYQLGTRKKLWVKLQLNSPTPNSPVFFF